MKTSFTLKSLLGLVMVWSIMQQAVGSRWRRYTWEDIIIEAIPFGSSKPQEFASSIRAGGLDTTIHLLAKYGEPTGVLWPRDIPRLFSEAPWTESEEEWLRAVFPAAVVERQNGTYRDFALMELWRRLSTGARQKTDPMYRPQDYRADWCATSPHSSNAVVWVYYEPDIFGRRAATRTATFKFIRAGRVSSSTFVYPRDRRSVRQTLNGDRSVLLTRRAFYERYPDAGKAADDAINSDLGTDAEANEQGVDERE